jgi:hypothetical protein
MECFDCRSGSVDMLVRFPRGMVVSPWRMVSQLRESLLKHWSKWSEKLDFIGMRGGPRTKSIACSWQTARAVTIPLHPRLKLLYYLLFCRSFWKITYLWWNQQPTSLHRKVAWWWQITSVEMKVSFEGGGGDLKARECLPRNLSTNSDFWGITHLPEKMLPCYF